MENLKLKREINMKVPVTNEKRNKLGQILWNFNSNKVEKLFQEMS